MEQKQCGFAATAAPAADQAAATQNAG